MPAALRRLVVASLLVWPVATSAQPSGQARLTIDEDAYNVPIGQTFAVKINGERVTMRFELQADQSFDQAGVSFRYPNGFKLEDGGDDAVTIWTLQGSSAAVMLQRYAAGLDPASLSDVLVKNIVERYGESDVKQTPVKLRGAEASYQGLQLRAVSDGSEVVQNVFAFANDQGVFALMVQDARKPGDGDSEEYTESLRLLGESLKTGPAPRRTAAPAGRAPAGRRGAEGR